MTVISKLGRTENIASVRNDHEKSNVSNQHTQYMKLVTPTSFFA